MDVKHIHWMEYDIEQEYEYSSILNGIYLDVIMSAVYGSITTCRLTVDFVIDVVIEVSSYIFPFALFPLLLLNEPELSMQI